MKIQFLGHSAFYVEAEGLKALIDPFLEEDVKQDFKVEALNYIFLTHGHGDHLGSTVELAKKSGATVVANHEICLYLSEFEIKCHPMHIGGRTGFPFGKVKMTPALHGSGIQTEEGVINGGNPGGFLIEAAGKKLYHAGDTGLTYDMKLLQIEEVDVALLPIGGNFTMDVEDALRAVDFIEPKIAIPMHYNTFPLIEASPAAFVEGVEKALGKILKPGDSLRF
jgi:L-ascorbate metabolism protein UlaG (beta-lactamase superfamily)